MVPGKLGLYSLHAISKFGPWTSNLNDAERLMILLLFELTEPHSFWRSYLRVLPSLDEIDPTFLWPKEMLNMLNGSAARAYVNHISDGWRSAEADICAAASRIGRASLRALMCDRSLLAWSYAIVRTRSLEASDGRGAMLLPLLDLANHGPRAPPMHLPFASGAGAAGRISEAGVEAGEEVLVRYGRTPSYVLARWLTCRWAVARAILGCVHARAAAE